MRWVAAVVCCSGALNTMLIVCATHPEQFLVGVLALMLTMTLIHATFFTPLPVMWSIQISTAALFYQPCHSVTLQQCLLF
jgi:hypothetical protein